MCYGDDEVGDELKDVPAAVWNDLIPCLHVDCEKDNIDDLIVKPGEEGYVARD